MPTEFTIRTATPDDEKPVADLLEASYPVLMSASYDEAILASAIPLFTRPNPSLLASGTYYLAETDDGTIVGCGGWTRRRPGTGEIEPGLAHIRHFATHASWTGRGIGRSIYTMCENQAGSAGLKRFECFSSLNAEGFYASLGFEAVRRIEVNLSETVKLPAVLMERSIMIGKDT